MQHSIQTKDELLERLYANRDAIESCGTRRLGLFGSFAHNRATEFSDVDFLVEFRAGEKTYDNFMKLAELLEELFQRKIELVTKESLSPYIGPNIIKEAEYVIDSE